ncbi:MAG: hypothetical protein HYV62_06385 [Candidatus Rokubacteria bacterium]|nr:hypothetical protein [Candidatus Rokubacteria bacterium]
MIALAAWAVAGPAEAAGALVGGAVTLGNFLGLRWASGLVLRGRAPAGRLRAVLWLGVTGGRFGVVALALGWAAVQGWVGFGGLLAALLALPVSLVAEGLRVARAA